jgi:hypothetical protein
MALIGNQLSSSENNSYRVLDNLSSFTLTFDGSSSANVLASTDTIALSQHPFVTGQRVTYSSGGGSPIGGLLSGTAYYITKTDQNSFQLATSYVNAITNITIDLVGPGTGVTHSFNVAFDGINTKFKATYSNGTKCTISRAPQLDIAINGVVQQPYDSNPPPNGFTIEADATIVFSTAPLAGYTFWGKALSGSIASVETSDNSIDNFTGNGSTTNFTLSKTPANSQNVLVTINGVTQYPSDATGTRSYSTNANVLVFTAAPANGSLIQVRYIGFAGPTSSNVTGFYGRTGNVVLNSSDGIGVGTAKIGTGIVGLATALLVEGNTRLNGITTITSSTGLSTVTVGGATTALLVQGNARITGILTIGTSSITFDGNTDTISARAVSTGSTVSIGASTIVVGNNFIGNNSIGLGTNTTAGRNAGVGTATGTIMYNILTDSIEAYFGNTLGWQTIKSAFNATGGTKIPSASTNNGYTYHVFTSGTNPFVATGSNTVEVFVVGGGGGGGNGSPTNDGNGGGGAGAIRYSTSVNVSNTTYSIVVGGGGAGGPAVAGSRGTTGTPSSFAPGTPVEVTAAGGGGGGSDTGNQPGLPGGCGGGAGCSGPTPQTAGPATGSAGGGAGATSPISGWGNPGGSAVGGAGPGGPGGGGGGAGSAGTNGTGPNGSPSPGGNGLPYSIFSSPIISSAIPAPAATAIGPTGLYAGGGGGSTWAPGARSNGGPGGGGAGGARINLPASGDSGVTNTGGGGGAGTNGGSAGSGGSGIVIVRYLS